MKKSEKLSYIKVGSIVASISLLLLVSSHMLRLVFVFTADLRDMITPASSPIFALGLKVGIIAFWLAVLALLTMLAILLEAKQTNKLGRLRNNKALMYTIILSLTVLGITTLNGETPLYSTRKAKAETVSEEVKNHLENDVEVQIGTPDTLGSSTAISATVRNKLSKATDYIIVINALDTSGYLLAQDSIYTTGLKAHETKEYKVFHSYYTKTKPEQLKSATFKISSISRVDR